MKTIAQALKDEIHYPLGGGFIENKLLARGLNGESLIDSSVINSNEFKGAVADCLYSLIEAVNFSESDISISLQDRNLILKKVNAIYASIGEETKDLDQPKVYVGWS
ncbi:hypothetical protein EEL53_10055 [Muribaculaceae bacterium Isolate-114 (HZI)]|nr:hypothetical protein EEL53_10055 [Muribaculaceae bacterium Isolate-114 (HZI)]